MENELFAIPETKPSKAVVDPLAKLNHRYERMREDLAVEIRRCEKSLAQAHYHVGAAVLGDPVLWAEIAPRVDAFLCGLGPRRRHVDKYQETLVTLARLRKMLP